MSNSIDIFMFCNCHGSAYKRSLVSGIKDLEDSNINLRITFENLSNFKEMKPFFEKADIVIMNPLSQYEQFSRSNIEKILKTGAEIIEIPYVRFMGYWPAEKTRDLKYLTRSSVHDFPDIDIQDIPSYIRGDGISGVDVINTFYSGVQKLIDIEKTGDVKFVEYFLEHHKKWCMFKDINHPTDKLLDHVGQQVIDMVAGITGMEKTQRNTVIEPVLYDHGHYKPYIDKVKSILGLQFDLDTIYMISREEYYRSIIQYENRENNEPVNDLTEMYTKVFKVRRPGDRQPAVSL